MKTLEKEFQKPWHERDLEFIRHNQHTAIFYHGLPPLPDGAVLGGPGVDGENERNFHWAFDHEGGMWVKNIFGGYRGNDPFLFYAYDASRPPFRKDLAPSGEVEAVLAYKEQQRERLDPPESDWPAPPESYEAVSKGWGWKSDEKVRHCFWTGSSWGNVPAWSPTATCGFRDYFYLEAVPLPVGRVPFDGPVDFVCDPRWFKYHEGTNPMAIVSVSSGGIRVFERGSIVWEALFQNALYSDSIKGPWHKFEK